MTRAHIYGRVSTLDQLNGHSIDIQVEQGLAFFTGQLEPLGFTLAEPLIDEGQSAFKIPLFKREKGKRLADATVVAPGDHLIFLRFDRAFRSIGDYAQSIAFLTQRNITTHFLNSPFDLGTASGRMMANFYAMLAEFESDLKSERLRESREYHRQKAYHLPSGAWHGKMPGLKPRKRGDKLYYEKVPDEFEVYLEFLRMASKGDLAMGKMADICDKMLHELRGIPYKKSANAVRLWPTDGATAQRFYRQSLHQKTLKHYYGDRPEFHLPIHPRFKRLREKYEEYVANRSKRLPSQRTRPQIA
jgi:DNA invertase Pin-like site-specific DNA recombinase